MKPFNLEKVKEEIDFVPLNDFVDYVKKHDNISKGSYNLMACIYVKTK